MKLNYTIIYAVLYNIFFLLSQQIKTSLIHAYSKNKLIKLNKCNKYIFV